MLPQFGPNLFTYIGAHKQWLCIDCSAKVTVCFVPTRAPTLCSPAFPALPVLALWFALHVTAIAYMPV